MGELPVNNNGNGSSSNVDSSETDDLLKWIMDDTQIANFAFPDEVEEATTSFFIKEVKMEEEKTEEVRKAKRSRIKMEEETELAILEQKNIQLQAVLKDIEKEV